MENNDIISILAGGDCFKVTTEKVIELVGHDRPFARVLKVSTYAIITGETLLGKLTLPVAPSWWVAVDNKVCRHKHNGKLYILSMLDKAAGFQRDSTLFYPADDVTGIIDMEAPFKKADFQWWIPKTTFEGQTFCLPFDSIVDLVDNTPRASQPVFVPSKDVLAASLLTGQSVGTDMPF